MLTISDATMYICLKIDGKHSITKDRLVKLLYLTDWICAVRLGRQATDITWSIDKTGPCFEDTRLEHEISKNANCLTFRSIDASVGMKPVVIIEYVGPKNVSFNVANHWALDIAIERLAKYTYDKFLNFIYSTYPFITGLMTINKKMSLVDMAKRYLKETESSPITYSSGRVEF
jgi:hypothetical protein